MPDHIVVGGGIAGLVAARRLVLGGRSVVVVEASDHLGGQVRRHDVGGLTLDAGAESFATRGGTVAALATSLGLGGEIVAPADTPAWLYRRDGSAVALPATSVLGIPGVPLAADVIRAIGMRAALRAQLDALIPGTVAAEATSLDALVRRRMGAGVLEGLVAPVVRGIHSTSPEAIRVERAAPGLSSAMLREGSLSAGVRGMRERAPAGSQVGGIRGGMGRLVDELAADLERFGVPVRTGVAVRDLDEDGVVLETGERMPGAPVIAAPGVDGPAEPGHRVALVTLVLDAPGLATAPRGTGVLVADGTAVAARALTHLTAKWAWIRERAGGLEALRLSYDAGASPEASDDFALVAQAMRDAASLLGQPVGRLVSADVTRWERAAPRTHSVDGMRRIGEAETGTGLASVIAGAERIVQGILDADSEPADEAGRSGTIEEETRGEGDTR